MSHLNKKVLGAGAAMVALSTFVPNPFIVGSNGPLHLGQALAQATAKDTMNVTAKVVNPLKVIQLTKLNFGSFAVGNSQAVITMKASGAISVTSGDAILIANDVAGKVSVIAPKSVVFTLSIPALAAGITLKLAGTGATDNKTMKLTEVYLKGNTATKIKINNVTGSHVFSNAALTETAKLLAVGTAKINVGGKLSDIDPAQTVGSYTGTYFLVTTL